MGLFNKKIIFCIYLIIILLSISKVCYGGKAKPTREELIWYKDKKCYKNIEEVKEDLASGKLMHPPKFFKELEIIKEGVGDIDPNNCEYYWSSKPSTLGLMLTVAREYKLRMKNPDVKLYVSGLLRTLEYQNELSQYNNWADLGRSTHTNGATFDITVHPSFVKDVNEINTLCEVMQEFHDKGEAYFIDEAGNSCFHLCLHPDYEKKYEEIFYTISKEQENSSLYDKNTFQTFKNKEEIREELHKGELINLSEINDKRTEFHVLGENNIQAVRPEMAGFFIDSEKELRGLTNSKTVISCSEIFRTIDEQEEIIKKDPITSRNSPFLYGFAFQIDLEKSQNISSFIDHLKNLENNGKVILITRGSKKIDVIIRPECLSEYKAIYENMVKARENRARIIKYIKIGLALMGGLLIGFIAFRFYMLREFMKKMKRMKKKQTMRLKRKTGMLYDTSELNQG